jgi:predicted DNA-binding transcriptional regulator
LDDKSLGYTIMIVTLIIMVGYFVWTFGGQFGWISSALAEWAIKLPVILAVYMLLFIILWIGYTMATTPPPVPLESPLELETELESDEKE